MAIKYPKHAAAFGQIKFYYMRIFLFFAPALHACRSVPQGFVLSVLGVLFSDWFREVGSHSLMIRLYK